MPQTQKLSPVFYFRALTSLLTGPRSFFNNLPPKTRLQHSFGFLLISSLIFTAGSLASNISLRSVSMGAVFFVNAVGMVWIAAGIGYLVMTMTVGKCVPFLRFFSVYAFASGVTLLASWLPFFIWLTEPWKWWLIGTGMVSYCGLTRKQAVMIVVVSFVFLFLFFWTLFPVISFLKS